MSAAIDPKENIRRWSHELGLVGLWEIVREVEVAQPRKSFQPALWRWNDIQPLLLAAGQDIPLAESDRRVMILSNPGVFPRHHSTNMCFGDDDWKTFYVTLIGSVVKFRLNTAGVPSLH